MRKLSMVLIMAILVMVIAGCTMVNTSKVVTTDPEPSAPISEAPIDTEKKDIAISVVTSYGADDGNRQNYEKAIEDYEAATGNIVSDNSGISNEEWKAGIMESFGNGTEPDVLFYFTGNDSDKIIEEGKVVSIDEIRAIYPDYASNMKEDMLAKSAVDGKNYAVPVNGYWEGMFVNKKVLADCGVSVPDTNTTWEQFIEMCQTIADKGYTPIAASLQEVPHYWFEFCVLNNGSVQSHAEIPLSSYDSVGEDWVMGLNDIKELYEKGFFPENTLTAGNAETSALMTADKAAFMIDGTWQLGWFAENAADINNFTVTYVPGKGQRKSTDIIGGISMGYFIAKKAWDNPEKQAACVEFVQAMTTDEVVTAFGVTSVTALKSGTIFPLDASGLVKDAFTMTQNYTGISAATADGLVPNARKNLFQNVKNVVTGTMTAEQAVDECLAIKK